MLKVLYEDESMIAVWKPVGVESQSAHGFGADMVSEIRKYLSTKQRGDNHKPSTKWEEPYVGVIHRLDKPVSGVMVYAKTKTAAAALSRQVSEGKMHKKYLAVLCGKPVDSVEKHVDYLLKDEKENTSRIVDMGIKGGKRAELICRVQKTKVVEPYGELTLAEIELLTGRHHQIRVQMSGHGLPLWGDNRYNPRFQKNNRTEDQTKRPAGRMNRKRGALGLNGTDTGTDRKAERSRVITEPIPRTDIALAAVELTLAHPVTGETMTFREKPVGGCFSFFADKQMG